MIAVTQHWNPLRYARNARFVAELGTPLLDLLAPQPHERILDLGCGDGALTENLRTTGATVVGVDASAEQVVAAKSRGIDARVMDGRALNFSREFDAVISNAAMHWMGPSEPVVMGVARALKPGGRFVAEMGGKGNVDTIVTALTTILAKRGIDSASRNPWFFPDEATMRDLLQTAGFKIEHLTLFARPTILPGNLEAWLDTFAESFLINFDISEASKIKAEATELLYPHLLNSEGKWVVDYVRLRFVARLI